MLQNARMLIVQDFEIRILSFKILCFKVLSRTANFDFSGFRLIQFLAQLRISKHSKVSTNSGLRTLRDFDVSSLEVNLQIMRADKLLHLTTVSYALSCTGSTSSSPLSQKFDRSFVNKKRLLNQAAAVLFIQDKFHCDQYPSASVLAAVGCHGAGRSWALIQKCEPTIFGHS
ncbi:hypothetical protein M514_00663 [Trichuris suis]|uniref:Uncharacterized protein n=1 Tax=Trichuris suis TaxID=68888 RepID=A0A085MMJ1_9BILA|nr:hypothetical protein M513_00663 [Trichuris suis]KFD65252.1 hypothetical protein M514_00663 [Trichuris suis]